MKENFNKIMEHKGLLLFAGGAITALATKKVLESDATKKFCIKTATKIMEFQDQAEEVFHDVKDIAEDIRHEAKEKTKENAYTLEIEEKKPK